MNAPDTLLTLEDLTVSYRARPVLRGLSLSIRRGEQWAVLGPNGAGKTTLARILTGELGHYSGTVGRPDALARRGIAYVCFERARALVDRDRKLDVSEFSADARDPGTRVKDLLPATAARERWVELLGLEPILERGLRYLSTGELRKALLASAVLQRPGLLILDSPLDGLDAESQRRLHAALDALLASDQPVLLLARDPADLPGGISHVLLLDQGRATTIGPRDAVLAAPETSALMLPPLPPLGDLPPPAPGAPRAPQDAPLIALRDVAVRFDDTAVLAGVHWTFDHGQHCAIAGPNGCGKSTLLGLITGDNHKAYGQDVTLFGRRRGSGESVWDIKRHFGQVDTQLQLTFARGMSVVEVVTSGFFDSIGLYDDWGDGQRALAEAWLKALALDELASARFDDLSFGLQRMVLLARAMVKGPQVLVLDEPTLGLDAWHRRLLLRAVDHVAAGSDSQLLFVSHSAGDRPACINQRVDFIPGDGAFTIAVTNRPG
ncbi:ATP-binding cassette domain-containing protein [Pseudohaliea rubra]|uniref:Putative molybdenum transport ATP-binding protein modF n=1 Tax=Pseudohaliea rubra DSM 19751 TaxID=1265313 RepID=A0A095X147_9GAMM|nr:ATP-binding cassette domain-containing protein [Pseudohaliea rubra]KGE04574.1 putative molybdenum transport ATP-binding protein modF [Pseudohaliea rubra DSM 19751]